MDTLNPFILSNGIKKVNKKANIYNKSAYSNKYCLYIDLNSVYLIKLNKRSIKRSIYIIKVHMVINIVYIYIP